MSKKRTLKESGTQIHTLDTTHPFVFEGHCDDILCTNELKSLLGNDEIALTFLDPPFNQGKMYRQHNDSLPEPVYWNWMQTICQQIWNLTTKGGALYFMQREKNTERVLGCIRNAGWTLQNLIIWKKKTSAVPGAVRFGKAYQIIAFATKGERPRVFNRLRIDPPRAPEHKLERENGMYVTDIWDDIRELTSGYFAGEEPLRHPNGKRFHEQQAPIALLARIILSSSNPEDWICDPFAGTGTTSVVAQQLARRSIAIELDSENVTAIQRRLATVRPSDDLDNLRGYYRFTENLDTIWGRSSKQETGVKNKARQIAMPINLY